MGYYNKLARVECFFCHKLMPRYAPGTMISRAKHADDEDRYICSRCYKKITMVFHDAETIRVSIVRDEKQPQPEGRVVEV
jgi:hypothetical protein